MATDAQMISDLPVPPGDYLEEVLEDLGMSKGELATRMDRPLSKLSHIFSGKKAITPDTAIELERATGVGAHIWTGLETDYRLSLARQAEVQRQEQLKEEADLVIPFCYTTLVDIGKFTRRTRAVDKVRQLREFFGVMSLRSVMDVPRYSVAHRHGAREVDNRSAEAVAAWLRVGEMEAGSVECAAFDKARLRAALPELRAMTREELDVHFPRLKQLLAEAGVVLVMCPHFPKTKAQGATFFLTQEKAVLMMTLRYSWADIFWFTLFHEIGHLLLHRIKDVILEDNQESKREDEADAFARDQLVAADDWAAFTSKGLFSAASIQSFAAAIGVCSGIVVGRLVHEKRIPPGTHTALRRQYRFSGEQ